jgi:Subtilase family
MASRFFAIGALAALGALTASSAVVPLRLNGVRATPGNARLYVVGTRNAQQRQSAAGSRLDAVLADLSRHAALARPAHVLADLHSLSPAARFFKTSAGGPPLVLVDATTRGNPQQLKAALLALGLEHPAVHSNDVGGWLPVAQLETAAARAEVVSIRAAMPRTRTGAVTSQGDFAQRSDVVRTNFPAINGSGVTVGILSDSFNCYAVYAAPGSGVPVSGNEGYAPNGFTADYATDVSTGDLPANVNVLEEADCLDYGAPTQPPLGDEGRAMLQVVHDVAPGASLAFYTAENSEADFASGIGKLAAAGAKVIADDIGYFDEPYYQDGIVAQAIDAVEAQGVAYFSAAGNNGSLSYENTAPSFTAGPTSGPNAGEQLLNFDRTGATISTALPVTIPPIAPGEFLVVVVQWDQPYVTGCTADPQSLCTGAVSSVDLCITGGTGSDTMTDYDGNAVGCTGPNAIGVDPYQIMIIGNPANAAGNTQQQNLNIVVGLAPNSRGTVVPGRVIVSVEDDGLGSTITSFATNSATIQGHPGAAGAAAVGAAFYFDTPRCGTTPASLEPYSSEGGAPILFDTAGVRLAPPIVRQKPDFVGPDGGNDTFLGFTLAAAGLSGSNGLLDTTISECQNDPSYPNFFGTSAATPHAAGIAALMLQASAAATPAQILSSLRSSALPMTGTTPNFNSGYGFIQADTALVVPTLSVAAPSITLGSSTTLTWSSIAATYCGAAGNWSGAQPTSGSLVVTPSVAGTATYALTCINAFGTSAAATVSLTVTNGAPAVAPALKLSSSSVPVGKSTQISWTSADATSCTASGSWSGSYLPHGSKIITPTALGIETFTMTCSNLGGPSAPSSVVLIVTPAVNKPAAPTLTLGKASIPADTTTTITWSSANAGSCTASGNANAAQTGWGGTLSSSGSYSVTPLSTGSFTYTLYCTNDAGVSPSASVTLTVTASANTGGGGAFDALTLLGLAVLLFGVIAKPSLRS